MANTVPQNIKELIRDEEGFSSEVYSDAQGYSAGYGHFLSGDELKKYPPGSTVPQDQIDEWFEADVSKSYNAALSQNKQLPKDVDIGRLTSVNYQLGEAWNDISVNPDAFKETWSLMQSGDFTGASTEVLDSKWAKTQTPERAKKFSDALASLGQSQIAPGPTTPQPTTPQPTGGVSDLFPTSSVQPTPLQPRPRTGMSLSGGTAPPPGQPGGAIANMFTAQTAIAAGMSQPLSEAQFAPYTVGEKFEAAATGGLKQLESMTYQFGAIPALLTGDEKTAQSRLGKANALASAGSEMLSGLGTFEEFVEEPTVSGFFDQVLKAVGQFTPMAISSVATGFGGAAVQMLGKGLLTATSRKVTNEVMKDIVKKHVLAKNGRGPALTASEQRILDSAYATARKARTTPTMLSGGASLPQVVSAGTRAPVSLNPLNYQTGFWVGAAGQEYVLGAGQSIGEFDEAGVKLTAEEAKYALAMGIPQAAIGTLSERLFVGDMFKRVAGKHADAARRGATKQADEYAGWMMEMAKGLGGGFVKGATIEGITELAQEELFIQQRLSVDPNYSSREANLRRAESAFAGFFAGGAARGPGTAVANVMGKARALAAEGPDAVDTMMAGLEDMPNDGSPVNEPVSWAAAEVEAVLDPETGKQAVWLPGGTVKEFQQVVDYLKETNPEVVEQLNELSVGPSRNPDNPGILIYDPRQNPNIENLAVESDFSEQFLAEVLGYTQMQTADADRAVVVRDNKGRVVWSQATSEANIDATVVRANALFPNREKYKTPETIFKDDAVKERWQKSQEEAQQEFDFGEQQGPQAQPTPQAEPTQQPTQEEGPAPQQGEFDFTDRSMIVEGGPQEPASPTGLAEPVTQEQGDDIVFSAAQQRGTTFDAAQEGFITKPLTKAEQANMTEEQILEARENRPVMTWPPRNPNELEGMDDAEVNAELDKREALISGKNGFLEINEIEESADITAFLDTLPTKFLETFKAQARTNPNLILTPKQNENGEWTIATSPRDVLPGDRINAAERIDDVVTKASRAPQATRNKTPGWSVRRAGQNDVGRAVYMGNLVQLGLDLGMNEPQTFTRDTGRIADGFTRVYEALAENGYELLYQGNPLNASEGWQNAPIYQLKGGTPISFMKAEQGRPIPEREGEGPASMQPTQREMEVEKSKLETELDAQRVYFREQDIYKEAEEAQGADFRPFNLPQPKMNIEEKTPRGKKWARYNRQTKEIYINMQTLRQKFEDKAWTKPNVEGVTPLPENQFKTLEQFREFIIRHEQAHAKYPIREEYKNKAGFYVEAETRAEYENRMNRVALRIKAPYVAPTVNSGPKWRNFSSNPRNRLNEIQRQEDEKYIDKDEFEETALGDEFAQQAIKSEDNLEKLPLTGLNIEGRPTADPIMDTLQREQMRRKPGAKKGKVEIDSSWNSVMGGLWPQLSSIISNKLGYGGRTTRITTAENVLNDENFLKPKNKPQETVTFEGQQYAVADLVKQTIANMREKGELGKYIRFGDTDLIVIDVPANPTAVQQVKSILALGHELGHAIFHQELERSLANPKLRKDLEAAFQKDKEAGVGGRQYEGEFGFEEWFSDQMGTWLLREAKKPTNGVESFFKRLADKIRDVFTSLDANLKRRFSETAGSQAFDTYVQEVIKTYRNGKQRNAPMTYSDRVVVRNMVDDASLTLKSFMPRKAIQQIRRKLIDALEVKEELMPNDKRHWSVGYFLQPAHNYLRGLVGKFAPELANGIYSMSQSEEKTGHLNARVLLMYQRLNNLYKLAPTKTTITGKVVPDLDAFEPILRDAERKVPVSELRSPEAKAVRKYLDDFYEDHVRGRDDVFKRKHFYPRILAIAELQANEQVRADLVALLEEFNKDGPDDIVIYNLKGEEMSRTPGDFTKVVEAMIREGEDNTDNSRPDVADISIGTNESRAKYFREIPNERLRDIGALEEANTAIRRYVEDMTKRLDYKEKFQTTLTNQDIANIKAQGPAFKQSFKGKKSGDVIDGWQAVEALLLRVPDETNRAAARDAMKAMLGKTGLNMSPAMRKINSVLMSVNIMTYLTFATLASLPDLAGPVLRSKDLSWENLHEGFTQVRRYFTETQEMQQFARDVGVVTFDSLSTSIMQANEMGFMTPGAQRASDIFFKAIGLEWYTNFTRVFAAGMGEQFLIRQANLNTDRSSRFLRELQVSREDIKAWDASGRSFSTPEGQRVQMALGRFVEESIVRPNAAERPVWASNPYTALIWQLKSFFYAYGKNIVGGAMRESGNRYSEDGTISSAAVPLVLGALTLLPLTMLGLEMREWLKYVGRGFDEKAFRSDNMNWLPYTGELVDRAGVLGPYGLVLPMLEAGKYNNSFITPALGPTAERIEDLFRGNAKLSDYMPGYAAVR